MGNSIHNIVIAVLTLWSVISLIVIVVWATTPQMSDVKQCRAALSTMVAEKQTSVENSRALEDMVMDYRRNETLLGAEIAQLRRDKHNTSEALGVCRQDNVILNGNVTDLEKEINMHKETEANLTAELTRRQEYIEILQNNLTEASDQMECFRTMKSAAENRKLAAESQTRTCQSSKLLVEKNLRTCLKENPPTASEQLVDGCATPRCGILAFAVVLCTSLHLIT